jgi:hypothetical protein
MSAASQAGELKAQGVIEAAQDPNSKVTADDAQRKIVAESKKAGVQAFTFNPDASPEEKAAQARAVSTISSESEECKANYGFCSGYLKDSTMNINRKELRLLQI